MKAARFDKVPRKASKEAPSQDKMVIPLIKEKPPKIPKSERVNFTLRAEPSNPDSQTYQVTTAPFKWGKPEEWLNFRKMFFRILKGQNVTAGRDMFAMARRLLDGQALATFESVVSDQSLTESANNLKIAFHAITTDIFPHRALEIQCRGLRRHIKKPADMTIMHMVARLTELNDQLPLYPNSDESKKLDETVIKEIVEFAIPREWKRQMSLQRFAIETKSLKETIEFCKDMETYEKNNPEPKKNRASSSKSASKYSNTKRKRETSSEERTDLYCMLHGKGSHTTDQCKKLRKLTKKHKADHEFPSSKPSKGGKKSSTEFVQMIVRKELKKDKARAKKKVRKSIDKQAENFSKFKLDSDSDSADQETTTSNEESTSEKSSTSETSKSKSSSDDENSTSSDSTQENEFE